MYCNKCGHNNSDNNQFCIKCGEKIVKPHNVSLFDSITRENVRENILRFKLTNVSLFILICSVINALFVIFVPYAQFKVHHGGDKNYYLYLFREEIANLNEAYGGSYWKAAVYSPAYLRYALGIILSLCLIVTIFSAFLGKYNICIIATFLFAVWNFVGGAIISSAPFTYDCDVHWWFSIFIPPIISIFMIVYLARQKKKSL